VHREAGGDVHREAQVPNSFDAISILPPRALFNQDAGLMSYLKKKK